MVTGPHRDPFPVDQRRQVVGMDVGQRERDGPPVQLGIARPIERDAGDILQPLHRVIDQRALVGAHRVHAEAVEVIDRGPEPNAFSNAGSPGLELPGQVVPAGFVELDPLDHVPAAKEGRHRFEQGPSGPEHANSGRPAHLMAAEGIEVHAQFPDVDWHVRHRLRAVDQDERASSVRRLHDRLDRVDCPQRVRLMRDRQQADALELALQVVELQQSLVVDAEKLEGGANLAGEQLPGDEIAVVLHLGEQDPVAGVNVRAAPAVANEVDGLGRVAGEDHFLGRGGVDEARHPLPRRLVGRRGFLADRIDAAMRIGVVAAVVVIHRVDHRSGFLRRGGTVQVNQWAPVNPPGEDGEVVANLLDVEGPCFDHAGWASFIRSATVTDSSVEVIVPCSRSQKA